MRWTPHPEMATSRFNGGYNRVLSYSYHSTFTGWGGGGGLVHLRYTQNNMKELHNHLRLSCKPIRWQNKSHHTPTGDQNGPYIQQLVHTTSPQ